MVATAPLRLNFWGRDDLSDCHGLLLQEDCKSLAGERKDGATAERGVFAPSSLQIAIATAGANRPARRPGAQPA
jgi:hypothetical protein